MALLSLVLMNTGCDEHFDPAKLSPSDEGKKVEVSFNIGFADETDGATLSASQATKSSEADGKGIFSYELQPEATTKTDAAKPDKLYNLEIQQYDLSGTRIGGMDNAIAEQTTGTTIPVSLEAKTDCQLVIVAWGSGNDTLRLGTTNTLEAVQKLTVDASVINNIPVDNMNAMPYILHLEHVCVESGAIKSIEGKDARLLLKRLATRLTLNWTYSYPPYTLKQLLLESIPMNYNVIPNPDKTENTYPSLFDQFTTKQIDPDNLSPDLSGKYSYSCWIPANVRGTNPAATSQYYRIKSNAPTGSSYASFIAVNDDDPKKKLNYRVYLGGSSSFDFNIYSNTNYNYQVNFKHTGLPTNDRRVTIIDPIPASENNSNLVPTANCFMVVPGGAFCFNPYKYYINGASSNNTVMAGTNWCNINGTSIGTPIKSVRVLWQTKENGDVGDPVLGTVNSSTDHINIVDLKDEDDLENARIYCRVAPNTTGGSGVIAAYSDVDGGGEILWSWHIWVTDYNPDPTGNETVLLPENKRKQKYVGNNASDQLPMMDRNLGAFKGFETLPTDPLDMSKANGFHYQRGRKDPFPSSFSKENLFSVKFQDLETPPLGMLNRYGPDGITYFKHQGIGSSADYRTAYKNPFALYDGLSNMNNGWNSTDKTVHDPCPAGWRMPSYTNYKALFNGDYVATSSERVTKVYLAKGVNSTDEMKTILANGNGNGYAFQYDDEGHTSYFRMTGYPPYYYEFRYIGVNGNLLCREEQRGFTYCSNSLASEGPSFCIGVTWGGRDAHVTRCIQERE